MTVNAGWSEPDSDSPEDLEASDRALQFDVRISYYLTD